MRLEVQRGVKVPKEKKKNMELTAPIPIIDEAMVKLRGRMMQSGTSSLDDMGEMGDSMGDMGDTGDSREP